MPTQSQMGMTREIPNMTETGMLIRPSATGTKFNVVVATGTGVARVTGCQSQEAKETGLARTLVAKR